MHARTDVAVYAAADGAVLRVEITDGSPRLPKGRQATGLAGTGRGLLMIEQLATRWGVQPSTSGKTVWFELSP